MKKKRVFFAIHYLEIGGVETSLIGLLQSFDYQKYNVDLFIHAHHGELMQYIPKEVNLLPEIKEYAQLERPIKLVILDGYWKIAYTRLKAKRLHRSYILSLSAKKDDISEGQYAARSLTPYLPSLYSFGEYDIAISYLHPHNYVLEKVNAKKKICWIHTDYSSVNVNPILELPIWQGYQHIMSISPEVTKSFVNVFPSLQDKIVEMENILSPDLVRNRAEEFNARKELEMVSNNSSQPTILLSMGRFSHAKNFDNIPDICKRIINLGQNIVWYVIGYGREENKICEKIHETGMENHVFVLGKRTNPYPYIKACDIYVQPSRYEGKSISVREAQILYKPTIITDYPTAKSQIKDGIDGIIVPLGNEECAKGIVKFIHNRHLRSSISEYLQSHDYGNQKDIYRFYKVIEE
ncbi:MAG: glycosyltransferase [Prevotella sp.]|nr:glycosyltransferase [Prevotella sp.]